MSQEPQIPSEGERRAFVDKLRQFRGTLNQTEQRMLDAMAVAAFGGGPDQGDVQGYRWAYTLVPGVGYQPYWIADPVYVVPTYAPLWQPYRFIVVP